MSISQTLSQSQSQSLKLTDSMAMSLSVMQMSSIELGIFINKQLAENPILEEDSEDKDLSLSNIPIKTYDYDFDINNLEEQISLKHKIIQQIHINISDQKQKFIALYLTDYLNQNGYLEAEIKFISESVKCTEAEVENVLYKLQTLEPTGIFARNLSECLKLQMDEKGLLRRESNIILNNLELVAKNDIYKLAKLSNTDENYIISLIKEIKKLNPKPGANFSLERSQVKIPDVIISKLSNGEFSVELSSGITPKVILNTNYYEDIKNRLQDAKDKKYLSEQYNKASALIKAIRRRAETTLKTALAIFQQQKSFFEYGIMELKPMTLSEVAKLTGMHESTISRITTQKYISTPFGVFEMKNFFTSKITNDQGIEVSSTKIKEMIKAIIASEAGQNKIYSDDQISNELKKFHLSAARRTVAKYREEMKIPTSSKRKTIFSDSKL